MSILRKIGRIPDYLYRNYLAPRIYSFIDRNILSENKKLKNTHAGKRCFIIGGGPSIAEIDFSKLKNEFTFVMNAFDKSPQYQTLNPKFHLISDTLYYDEVGDSHWLKEFKIKDQKVPKETIMILNLAAKPFVEKYGLFKEHRVFYIGTRGIMTDKIPFGIDIDKYVPEPKNTMLLSLISAYYLGFSEIYLLGCEHNFLSQPLRIEKTSLANWYPYGYVDKDMEKMDPSNIKEASKFTSAKDLFMDYETAMANTLQLFKNYRFFYKKVRAIKPDIKIYNLTPNSFLDVFPFKKLEELNLSNEASAQKNYSI